MEQIAFGGAAAYMPPSAYSCEGLQELLRAVPRRTTPHPHSSVIDGKSESQAGVLLINLLTNSQHPNLAQADRLVNDMLCSCQQRYLYL